MLKIIQNNNENKQNLNFLKIKRQLTIDMTDFAKLTQVKMTMNFDKKHWLSKLHDQKVIKLLKTKQYEYLFFFKLVIR